MDQYKHIMSKCYLQYLTPSIASDLFVQGLALIKYMQIVLSPQLCVCLYTRMMHETTVLMQTNLYPHLIGRCYWYLLVRKLYWHKSLTLLWISPSVSRQVINVDMCMAKRHICFSTIFGCYITVMSSNTMMIMSIFRQNVSLTSTSTHTVQYYTHYNWFTLDGAIDICIQQGSKYKL